ncbi:choline transporter-like protein 1 [Mya arenaria]|uniref:choline transporter-like protein 1 n=1 Tax=Mya arenaria TaxID=6604 RepID=UPI0022E5D6AA|nr:choline transporter-like protein 1 [Mya arenaria]
MAFNNSVKPSKAEVAGPELEEAEFVWPRGDRKCTDVAFLLLFLCFIGGMGYSGYRGVSLGNPRRLLYGTDSWGNVCNQQNDVIPGLNMSRTGLDLIDKPYLFYFNEDIFAAVIDANKDNIKTVKICVPKCPPALVTVSEMQNFAVTSGSGTCVYDIKTADYFGGTLDGLSDCPHLPIKEQSAFLYRCVPRALTQRLDHVFDAVHSLLDAIQEHLVEKGASDIENSWFEMTLLCALSVVVAVVLTILLQIFAAFIIWLMVIAMVTGGLLATGLCWYHYHQAKTVLASTSAEARTPELERRTNNWLIGAGCVTAITVIVLLVLLAVRKHITLVVELFRQAGAAVRCMPSLLLLPLMTIILLGASFGGFAFIFLYIETAGIPEIDTGTGHVLYRTDRVLSVLQWYHLFGTVWVLQFIIACHKLTVAGAVAIWYFSRDKEALGFPVLSAMSRVVRYHLGSVAFGSFVITFVIVVRMLLSFVENRLRGKTHPVAVFLMKCFKCCLWCFERFIKFLSDNAYIEIAIHGLGFCRAARQAFHVVLENAFRVAAINSVGDFVLFLGKLATVSIVTVAGLEFISVRKNVSFVWLPVTLTAIFAYFIASCFMSVYEMAIDTIFLCFCEDSLMNDGGLKPYFMSIGLQKCISSQVDQTLTSVQKRQSKGKKSELQMG